MLPKNRINQINSIKQNCNFWEIVYTHPRNVSKRFKIHISSRTRDMPTLAKFQ